MGLRAGGRRHRCVLLGAGSCHPTADGPIIRRPSRSPPRPSRRARRPLDGRPVGDPWPHEGVRRRRARRRARRLTELQDRLWAEGRRKVLVVLQGIDAAGKDGTIRHVMSAFNPQGCPVTSFKVPSAEELAHDFLWRVHQPRARQRRDRGLQPVPLRGRPRRPRPRPRAEGGLVAAVRPHQRVRADLADAGTTILKFFLYIDRDEQRERFQARLDDPDEALEVPPRRPRGAEALGRLHRGVRGRPRALLDRRRALVRDPVEPEVVPEPRGRRDPRRHARATSIRATPSPRRTSTASSSSRRSAAGPEGPGGTERRRGDVLTGPSRARRPPGPGRSRSRCPPSRWPSVVDVDRANGFPAAAGSAAARMPTSARLSAMRARCTEPSSSGMGAASARRTGLLPRAGPLRPLPLDLSVRERPATDGAEVPPAGPRGSEPQRSGDPPALQPMAIVFTIGTVILPKVRDPRLSPFVAAAASRMTTTTSSRSGRPTAHSTCCTTSSTRGRVTTVRAGRSNWAAPGRAARSPGRSPHGGGHANAAARDLKGAARHAAYAAGQAAAVGHVAAHELGAAAYAVRAARAAAPDGEGDNAGRLECQWQRARSPARSGSSCSTTSG